VAGSVPREPRDGDPGVALHWHSPAELRIPGTVLAADTSRQVPATVQVTHYFDVKRACRDCGVPFVFTAREQKHWYEELGFRLEVDCVRCRACRARARGLARARERYEALFHVEPRSAAEDLEMAACSLDLIEAEEFPLRQLERVRMLLRRVPGGERGLPSFVEVSARAAALGPRLGGA
jgi:hypothetical protein